MSAAVLRAGLAAVGEIGRQDRRAAFTDVTAFPAKSQFIEDWRIYGGWILNQDLALKARDLLQDQGILPRDLGPVGRV